MRIFINIMSILILIGLVTGFIIQTNNPLLGDRIIGVSILVGAFILMPAFIIYRSKGKKFKDYMLTNENLKKNEKSSGKQKENQQINQVIINKP